MNLLFWNTNKKALHDEVYDLAEEHNLDLIILVESLEKNDGEDLDLIDKLRYLDDYKLGEYRIFKKSRIYFKHPVISIKEVHGHTRYGIYSLELINDINLICSVVHFPSKLNWGNSEDHLGLCVDLKMNIERVENVLGTKDSFIIGDFNMNPFESGLINAAGLNNISVKSIALNRSKKIYNVKYSTFYNPMWNFFGEFSKGKTPGTFYFNSAKYINHYWNMYDQIMLRPELLSSFLEDEFDILTTIKGKPLLRTINKSKVVNSAISDHLPLLVKFNIFVL